MMKNKAWKIIAAGLAISLWTSCGAPTASSTPASQTSSAAPQQSEIAAASSQENNGTKIVMDYQGTQVEVPASVTKVAGFASNQLIDLGRGDLIVSTRAPKSPSIYEYTSPAYAALKVENQAQLEQMETFEAIAALAPDVYFCRERNADEMRGGLAELGIPMLVFYHETPEEYFASLRMVAQVIGEEAQAEKVIGIYQKRLEDLSNLTKDSKKPTALILGGDYGEVANGSMLQSIMMEKAGLVNLATEIDSGNDIWPNVGVEKIFQWNPEYIFVTTWGNATYTVEDILKDPAWAELDAVKNKRIYPLPAQLDKWEYPYACAPLLATWMAHMTHSDIYSEEQMVQDVLQYYTDVYGPSCQGLTREILGF